MSRALDIERGLLTLPTLYLSHYILRSRADYYSLLNRVTSDNAWQPWILCMLDAIHRPGEKVQLALFFLYMLDAIHRAATMTTAKVAAARELIRLTRERISREAPKIYSHELLSVIFEQPYCRIGNLVERGIARRQTASDYLMRLADIGVLREVRAGKEKLFMRPKLARLMVGDENRVEAYKNR